MKCQPKVETVKLVSITPEELAALQTHVHDGGSVFLKAQFSIYTGKGLQTHGQMSFPLKKVRSLLGLAKALASSEAVDEFFPLV